MDKFLVNLYDEEINKLSSVDYQSFLNSLSIPELEALLGINKVAVAGPNSPEEPTGGAAKDSKVTQEALPKRKGPAELPDGKTDSTKVAAGVPAAAPVSGSFMPHLKGGWAAGGDALSRVGQITGKPVGAFSKSRIVPGIQALLGEGGSHAVPFARRLGFAGRMLGPHALLAGGALYGAHKLLQPSQPKYAQANLVLSAFKNSRDYPPKLKTAAISMVASRLIKFA